MVSIDRHRVVGPIWFGYLIVSTLAIIGVLVGRTTTLGRPISAGIATVILIVSVFIVVRQFWWMFEVVEDNAYSRGQRDAMKRITGNKE